LSFPLAQQHFYYKVICPQLNGTPARRRRSKTTGHLKAKFFSLSDFSRRLPDSSFYWVSTGVGFGLIYVPAVIAVGFYFERWRALATGIAVCGSGIGTFLMAPFSTYLIEHWGWRVALVVQAGELLMKNERGDKKLSF
jgi:hypothetical protein